VLVIEDDPAMRASLEQALTLSRYEVRTAKDGDEGIAAALDFKPTVIVCDVHLPHRDGPSILAALRQDESMEMTQFILMTGDREGTTQRLGMNLGADDYLQKPFSIDEFLRCVKARFRRAELAQKADSRALEKLRDTISKRLPHELMTPLTGILGLSEVLMEESDATMAPEHRELVQDIHYSAERLHHTLKNYFSILEVLEQNSSVGPEASRPAPAELASAARQAAIRTSGRSGRGNDLIPRCEEIDLPVSLGNLAAIVTEFVDNACKYSQKGTSIEIRMGQTATHAEVSVVDRGRGMTPEQISQLGAFRQFDRTKYEQQGLGLGLTLTQHLIARNGGTFEIRSRLGEGTTVMARWPVANSAR